MSGVSHDRWARADELTREVAIGGIAGLIGGVLVAGLGGRLFMRVAAVIDPSALGLVTSNGNRIGDVTVGGTVAFVLFVGLLFGAAVGVLWVTVAPWIPARGTARLIATGVIGASITPFFVIRAGERDFFTLSPAAAIVLMVIGLAAIGGVVVAIADDRLRRRLPEVTATTGSSVVLAYRAVVGFGLLFVPLAVGGYFTTESSSYRPPAEVGIALLVVGLATIAGWGIRVQQGIDRPPIAVVLAGRGALLAAVVFGAIKVGSEVSAILDRTGV